MVDGGDPDETVRIKQLLGFVDGQTTNPSLIAKKPEVKKLVSSGHSFTELEEAAEYRRIVQAISPLVGSAGVCLAEPVFLSKYLPIWTRPLTKC